MVFAGVFYSLPERFNSLPERLIEFLIKGVTVIASRYEITAWQSHYYEDQILFDNGK